MNGRIDYSNLQNITKQLKQNISKTKKKISDVKNSIMDKSKIENLAKKSSLLKR